MRKVLWPIVAFDSLRGVAALAVAVSHFAQQEIPFTNHGVIGRWLPQLGGWGVTVFFVLSGFCIHGAYIRDRKQRPEAPYDWMEYLRRRLFRIYPGMFVALVLSALAGLFWTTGLVSNPNLRGFMGHMFLFSNFDVMNRTSINAVLWSAIVECYFYLLYPFLVIAFGRFGRWRVLLAVTLLSWGYFLLVSVLTQPGDIRVMWQMTFPALWWKWCLGVGLAEMYFAEARSSAWSHLSRPAMLCLVLTASFASCLFSDSHQAANFLRFVLPFVVAAGVLGVAKAHVPFLEFSFLRWIGRISYSIYLFHPLVLVGFSAANLGTWWLDLPVFLLLTIAAGAVGYYLVEVPAMQFKTVKRSVAPVRMGAS